MKRVLIVADTNKVDAYKTSHELEKQLEIDSIFSVRPYEFDLLLGSFEFAVLLGGDGFIMRKSLELAKTKIPFFAINFGEKGFLAAAEKDNWKDVLEKVLNGRYAIEKRPVLAVTHFCGVRIVKELEAAGNVYIRHRTDMIVISVNLDGKPLYKEFHGDGVIVANATGVSAYNLAAQGCIISNGLVVTPISPHALNVKSLAIPESTKTIEIIYHGRKSSYGEDEGCLLFLDSDRYPIFPDDRVTVEKSEKEAVFIIPEGFSFLESLQKKLGLST